MELGGTSFSDSDLRKLGNEALVDLKNVNERSKNVFKMTKAMINHNAYDNEHYEWSLDNFEIGQRMGRGKFGRVFLAKERATGFVVGLKTLIKHEISKARVERQILREIEIQSHLRHPNILQMYTWFHDEYRIYLVLEFAGNGELYKQMQNEPGGHFDFHTTAKYTYQVADALNYCHLNSVIHRDIKPENLLLSADGNVKLADFGWSVHAPKSRRKTMCGTLDYLPPEMISGVDYNVNVDNWCVGVLCYEFLVGKPPFEGADTEATYARIRNLDLHFPPKKVPTGAQDLITKLLRKQGSSRISLTEVMKHPWIVAMKNKKY